MIQDIEGLWEKMNLTADEKDGIDLDVEDPLSRQKEVMDGALWAFDKHLLLLEEYEPSLKLEEYQFSKVALWVRVYDLSLGIRNQTMATKIGWKVGNLLAIDASLDQGG
ncbi:hypothetical protein REPUB_Repub07fG0135200 [Reevesia pubescens]